MSDLRITHWLDLNDFASSSVYQLIDSIVYILSMKKIVVLLSTYNGERFLCAQLDSLLIQEGVELKVLVRDDGSSDSTWDLLIAYKDLLSEEAVVKALAAGGYSVMIGSLVAGTEESPGDNKRSSVPSKDNLLRLRDYVQITLYGGCRAAGCE